MLSGDASASPSQVVPPAWGQGWRRAGFGEVLLLSLLLGGSTEVSLLHRGVPYPGNDKPWHNLVPSPVPPILPTQLTLGSGLLCPFCPSAAVPPPLAQAAPSLWFQAQRLF